MQERSTSSCVSALCLDQVDWYQWTVTLRQSLSANCVEITFISTVIATWTITDQCKSRSDSGETQCYRYTDMNRRYYDKCHWDHRQSADSDTRQYLTTHTAVDNHCLTTWITATHWYICCWGKTRQEVKTRRRPATWVYDVKQLIKPIYHLTTTRITQCYLSPGSMQDWFIDSSQQLQ